MAYLASALVDRNLQSTIGPVVVHKRSGVYLAYLAYNCNIMRQQKKLLHEMFIPLRRRLMFENLLTALRPSEMANGCLHPLQCSCLNAIVESR